MNLFLDNITVFRQPVCSALFLHYHCFDSPTYVVKFLNYFFCPITVSFQINAWAQPGCDCICEAHLRKMDFGNCSVILFDFHNCATGILWAAHCLQDIDFYVICAEPKQNKLLCMFLFFSSCSLVEEQKAILYFH